MDTETEAERQRRIAIITRHQQEWEEMTCRHPYSPSAAFFASLPDCAFKSLSPSGE